MTRLINYPQLRSMNLELSVSEQYPAPASQQHGGGGRPLDITPQNDTNHYTGTLTFIDNSVNPQTGTIFCAARFPIRT